MSVRAPAVATNDPPVPAGRVQRACACAETGSHCPTCADDERKAVQPKLSLGTPGDRWEQEADRLAEQLVADLPAPLSGPLPVTRLVQMQEDEDEERIEPEKEDEELRTKGAGIPTSAPAVARAATAVAGGGRPLSRSERAWVEPRFRRDLSRVRIHDDAAAGAAARGISARAYTLRNHIAFAPGAYDAGSTEGRRLLVHELVHTIQQGRDGPPRRWRQGGDAGLLSPARARGTIQRLLAPIPGGKPVCSRPPSPRSLGRDVHEEIQFKFLKGGGATRVTELNLPFTDTMACKSADIDRWEPPTSKGRPDLAIVSHGTSKVTVRLGEIKPYNVTGVSAGAGVMGCYEAGVARNADVCKPGESPLAGTLEAAAIPFCRQLQAFGKDVELGSPILWNPGPVDVRGRPITTLNLGGGLLFYACPDKLRDAQKKKARKKGRTGKKGSTAKGLKKGAAKTGLGKGGKQVAKTGGKKLLKGVAKKAVPGAVWIEAAAFAVALLAGATPSFGAEGMSAEEALLQIALTGVPPDVMVSDELRELLTANPDVLAKLNAAANGEVPSDEAAQAMIDMLEANRDLLDAETLEGIAALAESSGQPQLAKTAAEFRRTLDAVRAGKAPPGEAGGAEAATGPEGGAAAGRGEAAERKVGFKLPDDFKSELQTRKPLADLFEQVVDRSGREGFDEAAVERFRRAVAGLSDEQLAAILAEVAALPRVEEGQKVLDLVVELAAKIAGGKPPSAPGGAERPADAVEKQPPAAKTPNLAGGRKPSAGEKTPPEASAEEQQKRQAYIENLRDRARAFDLASHPEGAVVYDNPKDAATTGQRVKATLYFLMDVESGQVVAACDVAGVREGSGEDLTFEVLQAGLIVTAEGEVFENSAPLLGERISIYPAERRP